jgi:hypothetical protein
LAPAVARALEVIVQSGSWKVLGVRPAYLNERERKWKQQLEMERRLALAKLRWTPMPWIGFLGKWSEILVRLSVEH